MPAVSKIVDEAEVIRWFEEGRTYAWMSAEYLRKYNVEMTPSAWSNFRVRRGLPRRITRDDDLIPWHVLEEHRHRYHLMMLRVEARRRDGRPVKKDDRERLTSWLTTLAEEDKVVEYRPDTEEGFILVPRRATDTDLIRRPRRKTTLHPRVD